MTNPDIIYDSIYPENNTISEAEHSRLQSIEAERQRRERMEKSDEALRTCMTAITKALGKHRADELHEPIKQLLRGSRTVSIRRKALRAV